MHAKDRGSLSCKSKSLNWSPRRRRSPNLMRGKLLSVVERDGVHEVADRIEATHCCLLCCAGSRTRQLDDFGQLGFALDQREQAAFVPGADNGVALPVSQTGLTRIAHALKAKIFFATPYHAWERGLNENTNGLIRDFFPNGTDFSTISSAEVAKVERLLNARPRKSLGFRSPQEVFHSLAYS